MLLFLLQQSGWVAATECLNVTRKLPLELLQRYTATVSLQSGRYIAIDKTHNYSLCFYFYKVHGVVSATATKCLDVTTQIPQSTTLQHLNLAMGR